MQISQHFHDKYSLHQNLKLKIEVDYNNIPLINNDNAQKEYYLPDIFNFIHTKDTYIHKIDDFTEISGVNTIEQLKILKLII